jgi:hypothetical protein
MKNIRITFSEEATFAFNYISKKAIISKNERIMSKRYFKRLSGLN